MTRLLRRWFYCRGGAHRYALDMEPRPNAPAMHRLSWRCVDCGKGRFITLSDPWGTNRRREHTA